jgi:hypothetical protein
MSLQPADHPIHRCIKAVQSRVEKEKKAHYKPQARYSGAGDSDPTPEFKTRCKGFVFAAGKAGYMILLIATVTIMLLSVSFVFLVNTTVLQLHLSALARWVRLPQWLGYPMIAVSHAGDVTVRVVKTAADQVHMELLILIASCVNLLVVATSTLLSTIILARYLKNQINQLWLSYSYVTTSDIEEVEDVVQAEKMRRRTFEAAAKLLAERGYQDPEIVCERRIVNSPVYTAVMPSYMVEFGFIVNDLFRSRGAGVRVTDGNETFIATADHVYEACGNQPIIRSSSGKQVACPPPFYRSPKGQLDVAQVRISDQLCSVLGVKAVKLAVPKPGAVAVVGRMNTDQFGKSYGVLVDSDHALQLQYSASTFEGWSGAPIMQKNRCIGIHSGAPRVLSEKETNFGTTFSLFHVASTETPPHLRSTRYDYVEPDDFQRLAKGHRYRGTYRDVRYVAGPSTVYSVDPRHRNDDYDYDDGYADNYYYDDENNYHEGLNQFDFKNVEVDPEGLLKQIATSANYVTTSQMKPVSSFHEELVKSFPEVGHYGFPKRGPETEIKSMTAHVKLRNAACPPSQSDIDGARATYREAYKDTRIEAYFSTLNREKFSDEFDRIVCSPDFVGTSVNLKSIPGFPYSQIASTNKQLFTDHYGWFKELVLDRVMKMVKLRNQIPNMTPKELLTEGLIDPARVLVKQEAHKLAKLEIDRQRLVAAQSLADQMVQRLLFERLDKLEASRFPHCPSAPGIGFSDDLVTQFMDAVAENVGEEYDLISTDVPLWDWNVDVWEMEEEGRNRAWKLQLKENTNAYKLVMNEFEKQKRAPRATSDGRIIVITEEGSWVSGQRVTGSGNSSMRVFDSHIVAAKLGYKPWARAMGDDCIERKPKSVTIEQIKEAYKEIGLPLKEAVVQDVNNFTFCSHRFVRKPDGSCVAYPENLGKVLFHLVNKSARSVETVVQFEYLMRHHPRKTAVMDALTRIGWDPRKELTEIKLQCRMSAKEVANLAREMKDLKKAVAKAKANPVNTVGKITSIKARERLLEEHDRHADKAMKLAMKPSACLSPACHAYCRVVDDPLNGKLKYDGEFVKCPLHEDLVPLRSKSVGNMGITTITPTGSNVYGRVSLYWGKTTWDDAGYSKPKAEITRISTVDYTLGQVLSDSSGAREPAIGYIVQSTTEPTVAWNQTTSIDAAGEAIALPYAALDTPFTLPYVAGNYPLSRGVCGGIMVSWAKKLQDSEGYVEAWCWYGEPADGSISSGTLAAARVSGQYLGRVRFAERRSAKFVWKPDQQFTKFGRIDGGATRLVDSPPMMTLVYYLPGGSSEALEFQYVGVVEYHIVQNMRKMTQSVITPDQVHLANAASSVAAAGKNNKSLVAHTVAQKVKSHPLLGRMKYIFGEGLEAIGGAAALHKALPYAQAAWKHVGGVLEDAEEATPYLPF